MKKLSLMAACMIASASFAGFERTIFCSTTGPDCYKDGTQVRDGEVYALVWTADGATFSMDAAGNVSDGSKVIRMASLAKGGKCPPVLFVLTGENADLTDGTFSLYLLDTRSKAEDGTESVAMFADNKIVVCNSYEKLGSGVKISESIALGEEDAAVGGDSATGTPSPAVENPAKISGITVNNGLVYVEIENAIPSIRYAISAGKTPTANDKVLANGVNGVSGGKITLVVDKADAKDYNFFKVVRCN